MSLHTLAIFAGFVVFTTFASLVVYFFSRWIGFKSADNETRELSGSVAFRVAALHGLILALVFADQLTNYSDLRRTAADEATAIADLFVEIERYDTDIKANVQHALARYTRAVVEREWNSLGDRNDLSPEVRKLHEFVYDAILDLEPQTAKQSDLRSHMLKNIQRIAELRRARGNASLYLMSGFFWVASVAGLILIAMSYAVYPPKPLNLVLLSLYSVFSGLIMFIIFAHADPYSSPGALPPAAFQDLLETDEFQRLQN